jgi:hypothetical protein
MTDRTEKKWRFTGNRTAAAVALLIVNGALLFADTLAAPQAEFDSNRCATPFGRSATSPKTGTAARQPANSNRSPCRTGMPRPNC